MTQRKKSDPSQQQASPLLPATPTAIAPPFVGYPQASVSPYHAHHVIPIVYHQSAVGQPQYFIPVASPNNAMVPHTPILAGPASIPILPNASPTTTPSTKFERILPKRPSEGSVSVTSSPAMSPYAYAVHASPTSGPLAPLPPPSMTLSPQPLLPAAALSPHAPMAYAHPLPPPMYPAQSTADQREKARKMSHSAIERRRRERINDKIMQLKSIIPTCANQEYLHKLSILQSAIDYIKYLKTVVEEQDLGDQKPPLPPPSPTSTATLAEEAHSPSSLGGPALQSLPANHPHYQRSPPTPTPSMEEDPTKHPLAATSATSIEPLKPKDVMKAHALQSSQPSRSPTPPSGSMKLDHLLT
ncbi:HLH-domain-containing protein [Hesseltinella vesiculosa]|uniref:HLH-domain-containing protein n=1 Tax=Hesseltinella vesiculosa TaxID=101127 RepID=A0A1X2GJ54_9FUNG|nr:HLH-domain-containing protein [Hesseltinella vesiculosa]